MAEIGKLPPAWRIVPTRPADGSRGQGGRRPAPADKPSPDKDRPERDPRRDGHIDEYV